MKTIRKNIAKLLALTLLLTLTFSCEQFNRNNLEKAIAEMNKECPQRMEGMGTFLGGELKENMVIFKYKFIQENFELVKDGWKSRSKEESTEMMAMSFVSQAKENKSTARVVDQILNAGCGLRLQYAGEDNDADKVIIEISNEQLRKAKLEYANATPEEMALKAVKAQISNTKARLPEKVDEMTQMVDCELQEGYVVMTYEVDDTKVDFSILEAQKEELRKSIFEENELSDQMMGAAFEDYRKADLGVKYIYKAKKAGRSLEIKFESQELPRATQASSKIRMNRINR